MNKARRAEIDKAIRLLEEAKSIIESTGEEEREAFDNLPEGLQETEKGQKINEAADGLEEAASSIDDVVSNLEDCK